MSSHFVVGSFVMIASTAVNLPLAHGQAIQPLAPAGTADASFAQSVSASGVVVGYSSGAGTDSATIWQPAPGGYTSALLPAITGYPYSAANSIGAAANVIAGYGADDLGDSVAATWTESPGGFVASPLPEPAGAISTAAYATNSASHVAGFAVDASEHSRAVAWQPSGGTHVPTLLPVPAGITDSAATSVNSFGDLAGYTLSTTAGLDPAV